MQGEQFLTLLGHHLDYDAWPTSPAEDDPLYFRAWQRVSVALQRGMRQWISEFYFRDFDRFARSRGRVHDGGVFGVPIVLRAAAHGVYLRRS